MHTAAEASGILRKRGLRVTPVRSAVFEILHDERRPCTVEEIHGNRKMRGTDLVTTYRTLQAFERAGIVAKVSISGENRARFELARGHHHHVVCEGCGLVEDIETCDLAGLERSIAKTSRKFKSIYAHDLEFLGRCQACAR